MTWLYLREKWKRWVPFMPTWADGMMFMTCEKCHALVPHWRYCVTAEEYKAHGIIGCRCGSMHVRPSIIPEWKAAYWVLVRGYLIRKLVQRKANWDPRSVVKHDAA